MHIFAPCRQPSAGSVGISAPKCRTSEMDVGCPRCPWLSIKHFFVATTLGNSTKKAVARFGLDGVVRY